MSVLDLLTRLERFNIIVALEGDRLNIDAPKGKLPPALIAELKDKKGEIIEFLREKVKRRVRYAAIEPVEEKEYYALASAQKRLYFLQRMDKDSIGYNMTMVNVLEEDLPGEKLESVFKRLIERHESLRTSFIIVGEESVQKVYEKVEFEIAYFSTTDEHGQSKVFGSPEPFFQKGFWPPEAIIKNLIRSFDLSRAPLLRVGMIETGNKPILVMDMHHIIADGTSMEILTKDFMALYGGEELAPLKFRYRDFSEWQNRRKKEKSFKGQEEYWRKIFSGEIPILDLPTDYPRPVIQGSEGDTVRAVLDEKETKTLKEIGDQAGATLYMVFLSIYTLLLAKLSGQADIIVGTPAAGRRHINLEGLVGMIANTLAMRNFPTPGESFNHFLNDVKTRTLEAFENQDCQFEDLVDSLALQRNANRNPLFDVMFNLLNQAEYQGDLSKINEKNSLDPQKKTSKFDINWTLFDLGSRLLVIVEYSTKLFKTQTIERFIDYFKHIVQVLGEGKNRNLPLSRIEILPGEERQKILEEFNGKVVEVLGEKSIHNIFERQVEQTPDQAALHAWMHGGAVPDDGAALLVRLVQPVRPVLQVQLTYCELNERSARLAGLLMEKGVKPDTIVGIMVNRSCEMVIGMLGILKAGGAYLPIDPANPWERKKEVLRESGIRLLLTDDGKIRFPGISHPLEAIDISDRSRYSGDGSNPGPAGNPSNLLYLIYTSGSTGKPKGVMLEHRNLINLIYYQNRYTDINFSRVLQFTTIGFDVSFQEIFSTLLAGGMLTLIHREIINQIPSLYRVIETNDIKTLFLPASFLMFIFNEETYAEGIPVCVEHIVTAGEQIIVNDRCRQYMQTGGVYLHNHYGPSETHVVTALTLDPRGEIPAIPSIGKPLVNTQIYILDREYRLQPIGVAGELYIGGIQVGRGYLNQPELTAERFCLRPGGSFEKPLLAPRAAGLDPRKSFLLDHSPFTTHHSPLYRTGDLARWQSDGNIEFMGRADSQVKVRGYRIELGEIRYRLLKHRHINDAVVVLREKNGDKYLCAYIVHHRPVEVSELRDYLARKLPAYMVPAYFVTLEKIPLTPNGKIDTRALPGPHGTLAGAYIAPGDAIEEKLVEIWSELLGVEKNRLGIEHNFFELGGNSLKLIGLIAKIYSEFGVELSVTQIYENPIIKQISKKIKAREFVENPVVLLNREKPGKIFCFPPQMAYGVFYTPIAAIIDEYSWYAFSFIEEEDRLNKYVEIITRKQPEGPYIFLGYSAAGPLAFEITRALEKSGGEVTDIIFLDCFFTRDRAPITGEMLRRHYAAVDQFLESMALSFLKEKVLNKSVKYMEYWKNVKSLEKINAHVHLILSEEMQKDGKTGECWQEFTREKVSIYKGFGDHQTMFDSGTVEKNGEIIKKILNRLDRK